MLKGSEIHWTWWLAAAGLVALTAGGVVMLSAASDRSHTVSTDGLDAPSSIVVGLSVALFVEVALIGRVLRTSFRRAGSTERPNDAKLHDDGLAHENGPSGHLGVALLDYRTGTRISIVGSRLTIGRDTSNDVVLPAGTVSALHAQIERRGCGYFVVDLASTNGTFVNGRRATGATQLEDGDRIEFDEFRFQFLSPAPGGSSLDPNSLVHQTISRPGIASEAIDRSAEPEPDATDRPLRRRIEAFAAAHVRVQCDLHDDRRAMVLCARCDRAICDWCVAEAGDVPTCAECARHGVAS